MIQMLAALLLLTSGAGDLESHVTQFRLDNGLEVLVYVDSSAPVVSVNAFYRVGSYYEPSGMTGISHMLEHLTFKRTDVYAPGDFDRIVDEAGGRNNGFTSTFYSGYYEDLASDRWELGMKLEAARMGRCVFPDSEFDSEHEVVTEERRLSDNRPTSALWEQLEATAFLANPQRNPTIGWMDDVRRFTARAAREWYARHYNPANAILVIAGDVRPEDARAKVRQYFGKLRGRPVEHPDFYASEPRQDGQRRLVVKRRVRQPSMTIAYRSPGIRDSLFYAAEVAAGILGSGRSSRLYQRLVRRDGLASSVYAWNSVQRDPGLLRIGVTPLHESLTTRIEATIGEETERMRTELVSERELERVRNALLAARMFDKDDISDVAYTLAATHLTADDWRAADRYFTAIDAVTPEAIREFCRRYLTEDQSTVGILVSREEAR